ncbi:MAG: DNA polymerase, partial [Planctomycetia bacterium]
DGWSAKYVPVVEPWDFDDLLAELRRRRRFCVDLETTSLDAMRAKIVGVALAYEAGQAFYIPVAGPDGEELMRLDDVLAGLKPLLEDPSIEKVGQNLKYDMVVLRCAGVRLRGVAFDSMVASYLLEPGERNHNLDELALRLLDHQTIKIEDLIGKTERGKTPKTMDQVPVLQVVQYAGEDADVALRLCDLLKDRLKADGLDGLFRDLERPLVEVLADMEFRGVRVAPERLLGMSGEFAVRLEALTQEAHALAGREFNVDSPTQLRDVLFDELKLPILKRTKTGASTDVEVLEELAEQHELPAVVIEYRKLSKLKSTYLDELPQRIHPNTGRVHASFNQTVAATGRLSSSEPNLQNIPVRTDEGRQIRRAFLPGDEKRLLLTADYSQIELRLLAHFCGDPKLRQAFADDRDIHAVVAAQIHGVPEAAVTAGMRRLAKTVNFGVLYGLSPFGLARRLKIDKMQAAQFIDAYFEQYPAIDTFFHQVLTAALDDRFVRTILGRRRPIHGIKNTTGRQRNLAERTAINAVIQGSAADLIKKAMTAIHRRLEDERLPAALLLQIHDEL